MSPEISFEFSWVYNQHWIEVYSEDQFPSDEDIQNYISEIKPIWKPIESEIMQSISQATHLDWFRKIIPCFVVGVARPFSHPLTIGVQKDKEFFIDILVHELIHNILFDGENSQSTEQYFSELPKKYPDEEPLTRSHILIHAVHEYVFRKVFSTERMNREISRMKQFPAYARSWELVQKIGYQHILEEFYQTLN